MKIVGWLASAVGLAGVFACNAITPLFWVLRSNLRDRARDLLAIPDAGLGAALAVTDTVTDWLRDASGGIADIKAKADLLAAAPGADPDGATALAAAIDDFIAGPYARLRTVYTGLRDRALAVGETLQGIGRAVPVLAIASSVADRLQAIDARMQELDSKMTALAQVGPAGLAVPGVAATVSERAVDAEAHIEAIGELIADVAAWLHESQDRVAAADRRTGRVLTIGAIVGTALSLFVAWLNILLIQQGQRWSRR